MDETQRKIIDLEHERERRKLAEDERKISDERYAKKDYERAVRWAIIALAGGLFLGVINAVTGGVVDAVLAKIR